MAVIAVAGGVAWAAESLAVAIPQGPVFSVTAVVVPGEGGGTVFGGPNGIIWDDDIRFSVGLGAGGVSINGVHMGTCNTEAPHTVTVTGYKVMGAWYCDTTVVDAQSGATVSQTGHAMGGCPCSATASAQSVTALSAQ